jgi:chromosome segregation ATPase
LRKTLIIIDEAHKLYGGDLKAAERPDMEVMERLLQNSYDKSGKDSARLLIMTATPFTNSPMELFKLINLCKEVSSEKIPDDIQTFKRTYMDKDNMISELGSKKLADKLSGYISYLNREQDPTQFAQPVMIEVPAIMSHLTDNELRRELFKENDKSKWNAAEEKMKLKRDMEYIKELKQRLKETQKNGKASLKEKKDRCKTIKNREEKAKCNKEAEEENEREVTSVINEIREEIEELKNDAIKGKETIRGNKNKVRDMKDKIRDLKDSLLQEIALVKRCRNVELTKAAE